MHRGGGEARRPYRGARGPGRAGIEIGRGRGGQDRGRGRGMPYNTGDTRNPGRGDQEPDGGPFQNRGRDANGRGSRGRGRGGNSGAPRETRPLGLEKLRTLSEAINDDGLLEGLTMDGSFYALINMEDKPHWDRRKLILTVLARASRFNVAHFRIALHELLRRVVDSNFLQKWLPEDVVSVRYRIGPFNGSTQQERERFIESVCTLLAEILDKLPDSAMQFSQLATATLDSLKDASAFETQTGTVDEPVFRRVQKRLQTLWDDIVLAKQRDPEEPEQRRGPRERDPLDDFRQLPILPRQEEILTDEKPRLRRNKKKGAYMNVDHYLDILFRLLREDFVWPIRDAINSITEQEQPELLQQAGHGRPKQLVRIYSDVFFKEPEFDKKSAMMVYEVQFDITAFNRVNWETTRRLLQGSLLCFTSDGFRTLFFATTYDRDPKKLAKGIVKVTIDQFPLGGLDRRQPYSFVESPSFFEAYKHVLRALQAIRGPEDMPFPQQLVFCNPEVQPPAYIDASPTVDFTCLLPEKERGLPLLVNDVRRAADWPPKERIGLDGSQYEALRQALTKRLAIIQGPPGTGKTYVGLKIVQILLQKINAMGPILVVCYTNHALDQFLDGIAEFIPERDHGSIVRMGGTARMKESVQKFQMKNFTENRPDPLLIRMRLQEVKSQRKAVEGDIEAMKQLAMNRQRWLLTKEQIRRISGAQTNALFDIKLQYPNIMKKDDDVLNIWLYRLESLDEPPPSNRECNGAYRLAGYTGFDPYVCLKALRASGQQGEPGAMQWLNMLFELNAFGYPIWEAVFALQLHGGNVDAAANWLFESLGFRGPNGGGLPVPQAAAAAPTANTEDVQQDKEPDEQAVLGDEILELERDYNDLDDLIRDDDDGAPGFDRRNNEIFTIEGAPPNLPLFITTCIENATPMTPQEAENAIRDPWGLAVPQRWRLYRYWQQRWFAMAEEAQRNWEEQYQRFTEEIRECHDLCLLHHLRSAKVIAMTTTGAAKKQAVLHQLQPKVVVIEEAAEVLEAHIVTSLSTGCQHLILIGDHKQLRPNPSVYELAKHYDLDVSLFERLINNGFQHAQLKEQHRMKPEISDTLMPRFYEDGLINHRSVYTRESIRGMAKNMYFIDHRQHENDDGDSTSHKNVHEARYLVALCKYLIQQGYQPDKITILCCYLAQMFEIKRMVMKEFLEKDRVRVAVVDNFQGEENDIILLSMVRSNREGRVGFLNTDNRVCVALSRARDGFYVVGNFDHLAKNSKLWEDLVERFKAADCMGPALDIRCQIHGESRMITKPEDFVKEAPEGGCKEMCDMRMPCGHVCNRRCHPTDPKHEQTKCSRWCEKRCPEGHECRKMCYEECGNCTESVKKNLDCGHEVTTQCYRSANMIYCTASCPRILPGCGHQCQQRCGDICNGSKCYVKVEKTLSCGHVASIPCNQDPAGYSCKAKVKKSMPFCNHVNEVYCSTDITTLQCPQPCGIVLKCGDRCAGTCSQCRRGRLHKKCEEDCKRVLICGHECKEKCSKACPPCCSPCENRCVHSKCGRPQKRRGNGPTAKARTCGEPCPTCVERCAWKCGHHQCTLRCFESCNRPRCVEKCPKILKCKHNCIGACGDTCPKICRECNKDDFEDLVKKLSEFIPIDEDEKANVIFVLLDDCGHLFEMNFLDQWFDTKVATMKVSEKVEIQLLQCPLCKTPVRTTQRYGAVAKQCLQDVQTVKVKENGNPVELKNQRQYLQVQLERFDGRLASGSASKAVSIVRDLVQKPDVQHLDRNRLANLENLIRFMDQMIKFQLLDMKSLDEYRRDERPQPLFTGLRRLVADTHAPRSTVASRYIEQFYGRKDITTDGGNSLRELVRIVHHEVESLFNWISTNAKSCSQQMVEEFGYEWRRTVIFARLIEVLLKATDKGKEIDHEGWTQLEEAMKLINGENAFVADVEQRCKSMIESLIKISGLNSGLGITEKEKIEVLKAMGFQRGHWYKCPNGHIYCIGDCGGASVEAKCPECKATIGGHSHVLRADNSIATEMDGATRSRYEEAVLGDHDFALRMQERWNRGIFD